MTEVLLVAVAVALTVACGVFVAAEFSLTTVERNAVERAVNAGERGASTALEALTRLTFQLSGAQLGIAVTSLVIGMLAEPRSPCCCVAPCGRRAWGSSGADTAALVLGVGVSTIVLMGGW